MRIGDHKVIEISTPLEAAAIANTATGLIELETKLPTIMPSGIAMRVNTREKLRTLPNIFEGTVSCRIDVTIVFHATLQIVTIPKAIPVPSQSGVTNAYRKPHVPIIKNIGIKVLLVENSVLEERR